MASKFWNQILSSRDTTSSKRLVTLIISLHFIIASFAILFIAFYVIFYLPRGMVNADLLTMLKQVLEYDFYIILSGLGFITADNMAQIMLEKSKDKNALMGALATPAVIAPAVKPTPDQPAQPPYVPAPTQPEDPIITTPPPEDGDPIEIFETDKPE
jgi:hypothetical protein